MSQPSPTPTPRRSVWPLLVSVLLLLLFAALVAHQVQAKRPRVVTDEELLEQLAKAEFLEEPAPAGPGRSDWPQWRGWRRDGVAWTEPLQPEWPKKGLERLWQIDGGQSYSSFAVADGRFYTQFAREDKQVILCLNAVTGKEIWRESYDRPTVPSHFDKTYGNWPRSTPVLDEDQMYTVDQAGRLQCRKTETGALLWERNFLEEYEAPLPTWGIAFSPLVIGKLVYANPGGRKGNSIVALDRKTGKEVWKALDDPAGYSSPIALRMAGLQQVVFFTGTGVVGLTAQDGRLLWRFPWETANQIHIATPLAFRTGNGQEQQQYVFISSGYHKGCALLRIEVNHEGRWDARRVFESDQLCCHVSSPVRCQDHLYGFNEAMLTCMSLRDGEVKWTERGYHKGNLLLAEPTRGQPLLVVLGEEGRLALIEANPSGCHVVAKTRPAEFSSKSKCWTMPVLAEGKLYLRDEDQIVCLKMPEEAGR